MVHSCKQLQTADQSRGGKCDPLTQAPPDQNPDATRETWSDARPHRT
jgi:hypothetical protein